MRLRILPIRSLNLRMYLGFLLVMLWGPLVSLSNAQQFDTASVNTELASASAAVIQGNDKNSRTLQGVTNRKGGAVPAPVPMSNPELRKAGNPQDTMIIDEESYWREVKAIIGGVLGFWGGVGGLGAMFLVIVLSQRYCCKDEDDGKEDG